MQCKRGHESREGGPVVALAALQHRVARRTPASPAAAGAELLRTGGESERWLPIEVRLHQLEFARWGSAHSGGDAAAGAAHEHHLAGHEPALGFVRGPHRPMDPRGCPERCGGGAHAPLGRQRGRLTPPVGGRLGGGTPSPIVEPASSSGALNRGTQQRIYLGTVYGSPVNHICVQCRALAGSR